MESFLTQLSRLAPQLFALTLFLFVLWLVSREYARLQGRIMEAAENAVSMKIGTMIGQLQEQLARATTARGEIDAARTSMQQLLSDAEAAFLSKQQLLQSLQQEIEAQVDAARRLSPELGGADGGKQAASHWVIAARNAKNWVDAAGPIQQILLDPNALALDLEQAGDRARAFGQYGMALELYERGMQRDPDYFGTAIEYHCLVAETDPARRAESLAAARAIVLRGIHSNHVKRLADALIQLGRTEDLRDLCEALLEIRERRIPTEIRASAHRNLAAALHALERKDEAMEQARNALQLTPDDGSAISLIVSFLRERGELTEALRHARRLVELMPLQGENHLRVADVLFAQENLPAAAGWYHRAAQLLSTGDAKYRAERQLATIQLRLQLRAELEALAPLDDATPGPARIAVPGVVGPPREEAPEAPAALTPGTGS